MTKSVGYIFYCTFNGYKLFSVKQTNRRPSKIRNEEVRKAFLMVKSVFANLTILQISFLPCQVVNSSIHVSSNANHNIWQLKPPDK